MSGEGAERRRGGRRCAGRRGRREGDDGRRSERRRKAGIGVVGVHEVQGRGSPRVSLPAPNEAPAPLTPALYGRLEPRAREGPAPRLNQSVFVLRTCSRPFSQHLLAASAARSCLRPCFPSLQATAAVAPRQAQAAASRGPTPRSASAPHSLRPDASACVVHGPSICPMAADRLSCGSDSSEPAAPELSKPPAPPKFPKFRRQRPPPARPNPLPR